MKTIPTELQSHLDGSLTTLCVGLLITRLDGVTIGLTSATSGFTFDGVEYRPSPGVAPSNYSELIGRAVNNVQYGVFIEAPYISEDDILSGKFNNATLKYRLFNYEDISQNFLLYTSVMGNITQERPGLFSCEGIGINNTMSRSIGDVYSQTCISELGDPNRCSVDLTETGNFLYSGTVSSISNDNKAITSLDITRISTGNSPRQEDDFFNLGLLTFTSGNSSGLSSTVKDYTDLEGLNHGLIELSQKMYYPIQIGDAFKIYPGCDKGIDRCRNIFNNFPQFRGYGVHSPSRDTIIARQSNDI